MLLVVSLPPLFPSLWLINNGAVGSLFPLALRYSLIGLNVDSVNNTNASLLSLPLPWIYKRASPPSCLISSILALSTSIVLSPVLTSKLTRA